MSHPGTAIVPPGGVLLAIPPGVVSATRTGHCVGRWEKDTLVIDTIG
jgi:hypothetical protein